MKQFVFTGHATDESGLVVDGTFVIRVNEPPKNLTITPDIPEPVGGYNPGTVITYTVHADDDAIPTYSAEVTVDGTTTPLSLKAGTVDKFQFTIPG
ncbi:hypothetical protein [Bradyrhizobium cenepequi]